MIVKRCLKLEKNELDKKLVWASYASPSRRKQYGRIRFNIEAAAEELNKSTEEFKKSID